MIKKLMANVKQYCSDAFLVAPVGSDSSSHDIDLLVIADEARDAHTWRRFIRILHQLKLATEATDFRDNCVATAFAPFLWEQPLLLECVRTELNCEPHALRTIHLIAYTDCNALHATENSEVIESFLEKLTGRPCLARHPIAQVIRIIEEPVVCVDAVNFLWGRWSQAVVTLRLNTLPQPLREFAIHQFQIYFLKHGLPLTAQNLTASFQPHLLNTFEQ